MKKATLSMYISMVLLLLLLLAASSMCFAQSAANSDDDSGGGSVPDTATALVMLGKPPKGPGSGGGSVPDTSSNYAALIKSYTIEGYNNKKSGKGTATQKNEVEYYRLDCNNCCLFQKSPYFQGAKLMLPSSAKVTDTKLRKKLQEMLRKQMGLASAAVK